MKGEPFQNILVDATASKNHRRRRDAMVQPEGRLAISSTRLELLTLLKRAGHERVF